MNDVYLQAVEWLERLSSEAAFFRKKRVYSLTEVHRVLDALGRPDKTFKYRVIVGGTAGKGTVAREIEQTLLHKNLTVALITSPHLQVVNERIRLNGKLISKSEFGKSVLTLKKVVETERLNLTYYEVIVLAGILKASQMDLEILICEVGLGGEFDAVNAVAGKRMCGLTFIGPDHLEILGSKLENVAETKSKIFTQDSIFNCSYEQNFRSILQKNSHIKIEFIKGIKQKLNKKLARNICEQLIGSDLFIMPKVNLPCRWEKITAKLWLDGAHSSPRFKYLIETKLKKNPGPYTLILGMQSRHDSDSIKQLFPYAQNIIWTESGELDCAPAEILHAQHKVGNIIKNPHEAMAYAQTFSEKILVTGSLYLCGAVRSKFYKNADILQQQTEWPI